MKRLIIISSLLFHVFSLFAVLKEQDLERTLSVLRSELEYDKKEQIENVKRYEDISNAQHERIVQTMKQSELIALMLYSQKHDYTFDLTYACHEATDLYLGFQKWQVPFTKILDAFQREITRYSNIINVLESLPPRKRPFVKDPAAIDSLMRLRHARMRFDGVIDSISTAELLAQKVDSMKNFKSAFMLSESGQTDRDSCLSLAYSIRSVFVDLYNNVSEDSEHYALVAKNLEKMNDYAVERYSDIKQLIFRNGENNYFSVLSDFPLYFQMAKYDINEKYVQGDGANANSEWRGPIVLGFAFFIVFYLIVSVIIANVIIRFFLPERLRAKAFEQKKNYNIMAASVMLFAVVMIIFRCFMYHNFFLMASKLLIEFACLVGAVLLSLLIRVKGSQIRSSFFIYMPILIMGFIIIFFRIIFISNNIVNMIFPPILLFFTVWQWIVVRRHNKNIPFSDIAYTYISLLVMVTSCVASWIGYTLLAVQIFVWWLFQLTAIQAITCVKDILKRYEFRFLTTRILKSSPSMGVMPAARNAAKMINPSKKEMGNNYEITWFYDLTRMSLIPMIGVMSILVCIYMAADIFDLTEYCKSSFVKNFINVEGVCQLSIQKIVTTLELFFVFKFINYTAKVAYKKYRLKYASNNEEANLTLANNIISMLIWGIYFIIILFLLRIPKSGISIVTAGLATGVGFAMKDILENFFYGMSLMTGRIRVGDYIECDGIRGKVDSITYQSTQILTSDGSIMAFLNSSLFSKNFKNLTTNYAYELVKLEVGVAYGSDMGLVRMILQTELRKLYTYEKDGVPSVDRSKGIGVYLNGFGDNSVDLYVTIWLLVEDKFRTSAAAREIIYNALNKNNIEIPFPQRTVYIREEK